MLITVSAAKGGVGATTVAAAIGLAAAGGSTLVDLTGDLIAAIGTAEDLDVGVAAWLASDAPTERLDELLVDVDDTGTSLLPRGPHVGGIDPTTSSDRWSRLLHWCARRSASAGPVVVDVGPHAAAIRGATDGIRTIEIVVTRACYLAMRGARFTASTADGVVLVAEPGRSLGVRDVERAFGLPVLATLPWDPRIARAIDGGLVAAGVPNVMRRAGRTVLRSLRSEPRRRRWAA